MQLYVNQVFTSILQTYSRRGQNIKKCRRQKEEKIMFKIYKVFVMFCVALHQDHVD